MNEIEVQELFDILKSIDEKLTELVAGKRQIEQFATELQGKGPLALMSAFKGMNVG